MNAVRPTVTASTLEVYREQVELLQMFAKRIHLDFADGVFAPTKLISIEEAWWPPSVEVDFHIMYENPLKYADLIISMRPQLVVLHIESVDCKHALQLFKEAGLKTGVALLPNTPSEKLGDFIEHIEHILVFGGHLGYQGGSADLKQLGKVKTIKDAFPNVEIAWDGGINDQNIISLKSAGVDIFNVGGFVHKAQSPKDAYYRLVNLLQS